MRRECGLPVPNSFASSELFLYNPTVKRPAGRSEEFSDGFFTFLVLRDAAGPTFSSFRSDVTVQRAYVVHGPKTQEDGRFAHFLFVAPEYYATG